MDCAAARIGLAVKDMTISQDRASRAVRIGSWAVRIGLLAFVILFVTQLLPIPLMPHTHFDSTPIMNVAEFTARHQWTYVAIIVGSAGVWALSQYCRARSSVDRWILLGSLVCAFL